MLSTICFMQKEKNKKKKLYFLISLTVYALPTDMLGNPPTREKQELLKNSYQRVVVAHQILPLPQAPSSTNVEQNLIN